MMWDFFDAVYFINLDERTDRLSQVTKEFVSVGLDNKAIRISGTKVSYFRDDKRNACIGNHLSHAECILRSKSLGHKNCLIFEDDVKFLPGAVEILDKAVEQLPKNFDLFYLGVNTEKAAYQVNTNLAKLTFAYSTHAYCISEKMFDDLLIINNKLSTIHNDVSICDEIIPRGNSYSVVPIVAIQQPSYSDIEKKQVSYDWMVDRFNSNLVRM